MFFGRYFTVKPLAYTGTMAEIESEIEYEVAVTESEDVCFDFELQDVIHNMQIKATAIMDIRVMGI